jgi:hypothetical protein
LGLEISRKALRQRSLAMIAMKKPKGYMNAQPKDRITPSDPEVSDINTQESRSSSQDIPHLHISLWSSASDFDLKDVQDRGFRLLR